MIDFYGATINAMSQINVLLKLPATGREQDWEFEFADPRKLTEILDILERSEIDDEVMDAAALLLISSIEASREEGSLDWDVIVRAKKWFVENKETQKRMFFYWIEMKKSNFPDLVGSMLSS